MDHVALEHYTIDKVYIDGPYGSKHYTIDKVYINGPGGSKTLYHT